MVDTGPSVLALDKQAHERESQRLGPSTLGLNIPGDHPTRPSSEAKAPVEFDPILDSRYIGSSDQACKECRRRKAKCNKALPTCDLCVKYRRHCLYEKHARTPLTRKHLTEVETRLERAEAVVRQLRQLVPHDLRSWETRDVTAKTTAANSTSNPKADLKSFDFAKEPSHDSKPDLQSDEDVVDSASNTTTAPGSSTTTSATLASSSGWDSEAQDRVAKAPPHESADHHRMFESIPVEDFEWCEKEPLYATRFSSDGAPGMDALDEVSPVADGMASLSINEQEGGYLGVASGAALVRLLEPEKRHMARTNYSAISSTYYPLTPQLNPNRHVTEAMIDAYFRCYHLSYPMVHEPTFRAQYSEVIPRPSGSCWAALAYVVAAIGVWVSAPSTSDTLDLALFSQARSILTFNFLEIGNLTLVQALTLAGNYQQKRDKPNSGYNYLGLATRMAMGLGIHKEFQGWNISPLNMEIRRRIWWNLSSFDVGATITFSRPCVWPYRGVEVSFPLNVNDKDLTAVSQAPPLESSEITPYTAITTQAKFNMDTHMCYERVISRPFPSSTELLELDAAHIQKFKDNLPAYFNESTVPPPRYSLSHAVMKWRTRNLRIIMFRPFVIRIALRGKPDPGSTSLTAYRECLAEAKETIETIADYWDKNEHNRLSAWYGLYFVFQAALIPCFCLRNDPNSEEAPSWRQQVSSTLCSIAAMATLNASCIRCYRIISELCGGFVDTAATDEIMERLAETWPQSRSSPGTQDMSQGGGDEAAAVGGDDLGDWVIHDRPVGESPQTQIHNVINMMWPNVPLLEAADVVMGDDAGWMEFLRAGSNEGWQASPQ